MKLREIYEKFKVPHNLQEHMLRVGLIAKDVMDQWNGPQIDKQTLINVAFLHDLGNVIKFKIENDEDFAKVRYKESREELLATKAWVIETYGEDEVAATVKMFKEIGMSHEAIQLFEDKEHKFPKPIFDKDEKWEVRLITYFDYRVAPIGVVSINARVADILERYKDRYAIPENFAAIEKRRLRFKELEGEIAENLTNEILEIDSESIEFRLHEALEHEI